MILYINGDSHSAGAEAVNNYCFVEDDPKYWRERGNQTPHPDNLKVSYGNILAGMINATLVCEAQSAGSNSRIIRTTRQYLQKNIPDYIVIGWTTWEREEWYDVDEDRWYQVNASGVDVVPPKWSQRYKEFVINVDWDKKILYWHEQIWLFYQELKQLQIPFLFFNCDLSFKDINIDARYDWGKNYLDPYSETFSYGKYLIQSGINPNKWYHFGPEGHSKWANYLLPHLTKLL